MKKLLSVLVLVLCMGGFYGTAQEEDIEKCYDTSVKVIEKEGKEAKERKAKHKENCFVFTDDNMMIHHIGNKEYEYHVEGIDIVFVGGGFGFLLTSTHKGEPYLIIIDMGFTYIGIKKVDSSKSTFYYNE